MSFQYELWLSRWPVLYVMLGICIVGICAKMLAGISCHILAKQVRRLNKGQEVSNRGITKNLLADYERHIRKGEYIEEVDNYIEGALSNQRMLGIPVYQLENCNLMAIVLCFTLGVLCSLVAFLNGARDNEIVFIFTAGLMFTGISVVAEVFFRVDYNRMYYLLGMHNYLTNDLYFKLQRDMLQEQEVSDAREERKRLLYQEAAAAVISDKDEEAKETASPDRQSAQARILEQVAKARQQSKDMGVQVSHKRDDEEKLENASMAAAVEPELDNDLLEDILRSFLM